jgi:hypothetical protein
MRRTLVLASLATLGLTAGSCTDRSAAAKAVSHVSAVAAPAAVSDTTRYAIGRQLGAFRKGLPAVDRIDGAPSRDSLIRRFVAAVQRNDRAALRRMTIGRAEFAYLYYPASPLSKRPYELDPDIMWMQVTMRSDRGLLRLLKSYGGRFGYRSYACEEAPQQLGAVTLYDGCHVRHELGGKTIDERLFGSIIEAGGQYKFVGFSNKL